MAKRVKKKKKLKKMRILIALILLGAICFGTYKVLHFTKTKIEQIIIKDYYLANDTNIVPVYTYDEETKELTKSTDKIYRGTKVKSGFVKKTFGEEENKKEYIEIKIGDIPYYIEEEYLVTSDKDVIKEKKKYVRTTVTIYKNETDSKIASLIKKGSTIEITGYDSYDEEGIVNMYQIKQEIYK